MRSSVATMRILARIAAILGLAMAAVATPTWAAGAAAVADAVRNRDAKTVVALLQQRHDVNTPQPDGATALHWAAHWDDLEVAEQLIRAGANVNAVNDYGVTPLLLACSDGGAALTETLLAAGANRESRPAEWRDGADDGGSNRQSGCGQGAPGARRGGECEGNAEGADGADVGRGGTPPRGGRHAARPRRGRQGPVDERIRPPCCSRRDTAASTPPARCWRTART